MRRMMGEEEDVIRSYPKLKLQLMETVVVPESPEHPSTPPFQASASVPFKWEEQPGKPRRLPCSTSTTHPPAKSLDLPPHRFAKTPSPTTVLDGPYNVVGRPKFSSFRFFNDSSFRSPEAEGSTFESLLGVGSNKNKNTSTGGIFGKSKRVVDGAVSCRFSPASMSSCDSGEEAFVGVKSNCGVKMSRKGSFSTTISQPKSSQIWTSIYKGIKQVMHWKSSSSSSSCKKSNKEAPTACDGHK